MTSIETAPNQAEMGLLSITSLLTQISEEIGSVKDVFSVIPKNTKKIDTSWQKRYLARENKSFSVLTSLLETTNNIFDIIRNAFNEHLVKIDKENKDKIVDTFANTKPKNMFGMLESVNENILGISKYLMEEEKDKGILPDFDNKPVKTKDIKKTKITTESFYADTLNYLKSITSNTKQKSQVNFLSGNFTKPKEKKEETEKPKFDFFGFTNGVKTLQASLTPKFFKNLIEFKDNLDKVLSFDVDKFKPFMDKFTKFTESVSDMSESLKPMSKSILMLSGALVAFSFVGANPLIFIGIGAITLMGKVFSKYFSDEQMAENILKFSYGIGVLTASMIAMNFVNFGSLFMMVGFIYGLGFALRTYKQSEIPSLLKFAGAIGILTVSMVAMNLVNFGSLFMMVGFIYGLGFALRTYKQSEIPSLLKFASAIGILTISLLVMNFINFSSLFMMVGFIWTLGQVLNSKSFSLGGGLGSDMIKLAMGMGILTLALFAFAEIPIQAPLMMLGFITGLLLVLHVMNSGKNIQATPLMSFAMGIGILVLSMYAINDLPFSAMLKMILFIVGVGVAIRIAGGKGNFSGMFGFGMGMGVLVLAAYAINDLEWQTMGKFVVFLMGVAVAVKLMGDGIKSKLSMLAMAGGIIGISGGMYLWKKANVEWSDVGMLLATITGLGVASAVLGSIGAIALIGAGVMIALGASVVILAFGLGMITNLNLDFEKIDMFGLGCLKLAKTLALLTPHAILGLVGAALMIPIGISAGLIAVSLMAISALSITPQKIDDFSYGVGGLASIFSKNIIAIGLGVVGAALFLPISVVSLASAVVLALICKTDIDKKKIDSYNSGMKSIVDGINSYGIVQLTKVGVKSLLILPLMEVGMKMSEMMLNISNSKVTQKDMGLFAETLTTYIDKMANVINDSVSKVKGCEPGIEAIARLTGIAFTLADTVQKMANMELVEHEVKDGKLVVKKVTKFDFSKPNLDKIGTNIAQMVNSIAEPLSALGTNSDDIVIGGIHIRNPFSKKNKGIEFIQKLGVAYQPLMDAVSTFASLEMSQDKEKFETFKSNLLGTIDVIGLIFAKLSLITPSQSDSAIKSIISFIDSFNSGNVDSISKFNTEISLSLSNLSDSDKWNRINKNLDIVKTKFYDISKAIKSIDIEKATAFENNLKLLVDKNNSAELAQSVKSLADLLGLVQQHQEKIQTTFADRMGVTSQEQQVYQKSTPIKSETTKTKEQSFEELVGQLMQVMNEISGKISGTNTKLAGTLKVQTINGASNKI